MNKFSCTQVKIQMSRSRIDAVCYVCFFFMRLLFKCLCSQTVFTGGVMGLQCQLNLMSCLILMLVHFDKTPSWQKKTHSLRSNPVFLFFFFFFSCAYLSSSSQHTVTLSAPRRKDRSRFRFLTDCNQAAITLIAGGRGGPFSSVAMKKNHFGGQNGKPVWPQSAKQRAHLEGGFANPRTNAHLRAHTHSEELATR